MTRLSTAFIAPCTLLVGCFVAHEEPPEPVPRDCPGRGVESFEAVELPYHWELGKFGTPFTFPSRLAILNEMPLIASRVTLVDCDASPRPHDYYDACSDSSLASLHVPDGRAYLHFSAEGGLHTAELRIQTPCDATEITFRAWQSPMAVREVEVYAEDGDGDVIEQLTFTLGDDWALNEIRVASSTERIARIRIDPAPYSPLLLDHFEWR